MNRSAVWHIFFKEMLDLYRDRKIWAGTFLIPIVVIPFVFFLLGSSVNRVQEEAREHVPLALAGASKADPLIRQLLTQPGVEQVMAADPEQALREGKVRAVIQLPPDADERLASGGTVPVTVRYDPSNSKSAYALEVIREAVEAHNQEVAEWRLREVGLSPQALEPVVVQEESIVPEERVHGGMLSAIIPLMLVLSLASGGIPAATDLVAGERERGTLEPLMLTPVPSSSILAAKLLAVMAMNLTSGLASMTSLLFILVGVSPEPVSLEVLTPATISVLLLMALLLSALFGTVQLALSTVARTFKETQMYMAPLVLVATVPSYLLMPLHPTDIPWSSYLIPVYGAAAVIKGVFYGALSAANMAMAAASSLVAIAAVMTVSAWLFRRERRAA